MKYLFDFMDSYFYTIYKPIENSNYFIMITPTNFFFINTPLLKTNSYWPKMGLFRTIATRTIRIVDEQNKKVEKEYLRRIMENNEY